MRSDPLAESIRRLAERTGGGEGPSVHYKGPDLGGWMALVSVLPPRRRNRDERAFGDTPEAALRALEAKLHPRREGGASRGRAVSPRDDKPSIHWKRRETGGCSGYLGAVKAFSISPSVIRGEGFNLYVLLPGVLTGGRSSVTASTESAARALAADLLVKWLADTGLTP